MFEHGILLLGSFKDPQVSRIYKELEALQPGLAAILDFKTSVFELHMDGAGVYALFVDGCAVSRQAIVFDRAFLKSGTFLYPDDCDGNADFVAEEWKAAYRFIAELYDQRVVNSVISQAKSSKIVQQEVAALSGLKIPSTLICNDRAAVVKFADSVGKTLIVKPLASASATIERDKAKLSVVVMTNRVSKEDISSSSMAEFKNCPHFFQHEIEKLSELRIVWVNGTHFAFEINSQDYACTETDWRWGGKGLNFAPYEIETILEQKLRIFMKKSGLCTGSIDLIVDVQGEVWFLECNEQGVWAWLDDLVDGAIAKEFARYLHSRCREEVDGFARTAKPTAPPAGLVQAEL